MRRGIGHITPASGQSQAVPVKGSKSGGSARTPQAHIGGAMKTKSSAPANRQRLRG